MKTNKVSERKFANIKDVLEDKSILLSHEIFTDEFLSLTKEQQEELYMYCFRYCTDDISKKNMQHMRYAITEKYFNLC